MAITLNGTTGISSPGGDTSTSLATTNLSYTGTLTGGTGVIAIGTNQIYKDASGNVGLGFTPSAWDSGYSMIQAGSYGSAFGGRNAANTAFIMSNSVRSGAAWKYINTAAAAQFQVENGTFYWFNAPSGTAGNAITYTQAMTLDASGNLLVGTTGVSQTADIGIKITPAGDGANYPRISLVTAATTNGQNNFISGYSTAVPGYRFYIGAGGTISAISTTISAISDQRLKENIRDLDDGLSTILALKPRKFDWKEGKGKDIKDDRGFIAQEFEQVLPDLIDQWKDEPPEGEEPYKAVRADLIPILVKAIQELTTRLEALEAQ